MSHPNYNKAFAAMNHEAIQEYMDDEECPSWKLQDMYDEMSDAIFECYTDKMKQADRNHENYFAGTKEEWELLL